ncbi:MAG: phage portal protein [Sulfurimonas sp.]
MSGQTVNEETCMGLSAFYAAVRLLSSTPAALPLCVYRRTNNDGDKEIARNTPEYEVLHDRPNPVHTPIQFREIGQKYILLWGRSLSYIERANNGRLIGLWPMATNEVRPLWQDGKRMYDVSRLRDNELFPKPPTNKPVLSDSEVLDVASFDGKSIVARAREQLGEAMAAQAFGAGFYGGGAQPYLALIVKKALGPEGLEKLRENWNRAHGAAKRGIAVLPQDELDVKTIDMPLKDAQFLESRQFYVTEIARWFGIPPHKLYDLLRSTNNNIEEQQLEWYEDLIPHLTRWEQELHWKLFKASERPNYIVGHIVENLLRGNIEKRYAAHAIGLQWGFKSRNEVRRQENMNSMGDDGDVFMAPNNMVPADKLGESQGGGIGGTPIAGVAGASIIGDNKAWEPVDASVASGQPIQTATDLVLSGAQITAATAIVVSVAKGEQPRDAGIGQLAILFNLTSQQAEQIMGSSGTSTPTTPNPNPAAEVNPEPTPVVGSPPKDGTKEAARSAFLASTERMIRKEVAEIRSAAKEPGKFLAWLDKFYGTWPAKLSAGLSPASEACRALGCDIDASSVANEHCQRSKAALLELSGSAKQSEFASTIAGEMDKWQAGLPKQLADLVFKENQE